MALAPTLGRREWAGRRQDIRDLIAPKHRAESRKPRATTRCQLPTVVPNAAQVFANPASIAGVGAGQRSPAP